MKRNLNKKLLGTGLLMLSLAGYSLQWGPGPVHALSRSSRCAKVASQRILAQNNLGKILRDVMRGRTTTTAQLRRKLRGAGRQLEILNQRLEQLACPAKQISFGEYVAQGGDGNHLRDPGFEDGQGWVRARASRELARSGEFALALRGRAVTQIVNLAAERNYFARAWASSPRKSLAAVMWLGKRKAALPLGVTVLSPSSATGSWTQLEANLERPQQAAYAKIILVSGGDDPAYVDDTWFSSLDEYLNSLLPSTPTPEATSTPGEIGPSPTPIITATPTVTSPAPTASATPASTPTVTPTPSPTSSQMASSVSQYGITWDFDGDYQVGQFVNGDWWVVVNSGGNVRVTSISPQPGAGRHGFWINPQPGSNQPYDSRIGNYVSSLIPALPLNVTAGSSIVSSISNPDATNCSRGPNPGWTSFSGDCSLSPIKTAAVLTVLAAAPAEPSFRPPYAGSSKPMHSAAALQTNLLPALAPVGNPPALQDMERRFQRVWLDHRPNWTVYQLHPTDNISIDYGAGLALDVGEGALRLTLNDPVSAKLGLLRGMIQLGIDNYGLAASGMVWPADGGHFSGRKLPILLAGVMLDDGPMKNIGSFQFAGASHGFAEDCQTYYDDNPAYVFYRGTLGFPRYGKTHCADPNQASNYANNECVSGSEPGCNSYRDLNSPSWVPQVLAARLLKLETLWNHQAYFDYQDRWVNEGLGGVWGSSWGSAMWAQYRYNGSIINTCANQVRDRCSIGCAAPPNQVASQFQGESGVDSGGGCS